MRSRSKERELGQPDAQLVLLDPTIKPYSRRLQKGAMSEPVKVSVRIQVWVPGEPGEQSNERTEVWSLWKTSAPPRYDSSRTITVWDSETPDPKDRERYVLITEGDVEWHKGRYGSGLFGLNPEDDFALGHEAGKMLWKRVFGQDNGTLESIRKEIADLDLGDEASPYTAAIARIKKLVDKHLNDAEKM